MDIKELLLAGVSPEEIINQLNEEIETAQKEIKEQEERKKERAQAEALKKQQEEEAEHEIEQAKERLAEDFMKYFDLIGFNDKIYTPEQRADSYNQMYEMLTSLEEVGGQVRKLANLLDESDKPTKKSKKDSKYFEELLEALNDLPF